MQRRRRGSAVGCAVAGILVLFVLPWFAIADYLAINLTVGTVHIIGPAMAPTIGDGDYLLTDKVLYRLHGLRRGDIVVWRDPSNRGQDRIKRVIGLPGERVLVSGCATFINGRRLEEPYLGGPDAWSSCDPPWPGDGRAATLGPDELFVMGDNRDHSRDSREDGPIRRSQIVAVATVRILPLQELGVVARQRPRS